MNTCKCGCGQSLDHRRFKAVWASESCRKAFLRGRAPANTSTTRPSKPSGAQVSYFKAVDAVASTLRAYGISEPRGVARTALRRALPERQRERLDA